LLLLEQPIKVSSVPGSWAKPGGIRRSDPGSRHSLPPDDAPVSGVAAAKRTDGTDGCSPPVH